VNQCNVRKAIAEIAARQQWRSTLDDEHFDQRIGDIFDICLEDVNKTSGVGLSFRYHPSKLNELGQILGNPALLAEVKACTLHRLKWWASTDIDELQEVLENDPMSLVLGGFVGAFHVIVKNELHPSRKVKEKKFRNIKMNDFVNQMCERVLEYEYKTQLKRHFQSDPNQSELAYGLSFEDKEALQLRLITITKPNNTSSAPQVTLQAGKVVSRFG
jgi:hypothetical protein